jgi:plastocyanin
MTGTLGVKGMKNRGYVPLVAVLALACGGVPGDYGVGAFGGAGGGADVINATPQLTFEPATLTTSVGNTVSFVFGSVGHDVFFATTTGAPDNIEGVNADTTITRTFTTAGTFTYTCHIHTGMSGTVVVQ